MANPQPEPFVRFSKELFDAVLQSPLRGLHLQLVLCIIRKTYGDYGKKSAPISLTLLCKMMGRPSGEAYGWTRQALGDLIKEGVVVVVKSATFSKPRVLALNKNYEKWGRFSTSRVPVDTPVPADLQSARGATGTVPVERQSECPSACSIEDIERDIERDKNSLSESAEAPSSGDNGTKPEKPAKMKKRTQAEWQAEHDRLMAACHFASDVQQLAELMAEANKTGQVAVSRVVRELLEPIVTMQDEITDPALRHGLRAAITARAPNANYVRKATAGHRSQPSATSSARAISGVTDDAWEEQLKEAYSDD